MHDIVKYLQTGELPKMGSMHKVLVQVVRFTLIIDSLNRRSFGGPYLRCLSDLKAQYVLAKLHKGVYALIPRVPSEILNPVRSPWSFTRWGMDIVGPLPLVVAQKKFLLVGIDYFSKWDVSKFIWKTSYVDLRSHKQL
ncbi:hypothetical protein AAG906_002786 [Vitis piasezkii]